MYQLVLQFAPWSAKDFDDLVALEDALIVMLGKRVTVDGHDTGSGEAHIFVLTEQPNDHFRECWKAVQRSSLKNISAAYRDLATDEYTRLWPPGDASPFLVK